MTRIVITFFLVLAAALYSVPAKADGQALPTLFRHNVNYESACTKQNLRELKKTLGEINVKAKEQVWKAILVLLCADVTATNRYYVDKLLTAKVELTTGGIDDDPTPKHVNKGALTAEDLFAKGTAFGAGIADMPNELTLIYYRDEACVASKKLKYVKNRWRLTAVSLGCD